MYGRGRVKKDPGVETAEEANKGDGKGMSFDLMQSLQKMTQIDVDNQTAIRQKQLETDPDPLDDLENLTTTRVSIFDSQRPDEPRDEIELDLFGSQLPPSKHMSRILNKFSLSRQAVSTVYQPKPILTA